MEKSNQETVQRKKQRIADTVANKRGSRINNDTCDNCGAQFKSGWLYKSYDHKEIAICPTCKARLSKGKMNYHRMVVG